MNRPPRRLGASLLLILASLVVGVAVAELALRLVGYSEFVFDRPDVIRGYSLRPNAVGWQTTEGRAEIRINSYGYRDREHFTAKPSGVYRVALVGDSFVEARQVAFEDSFGAIVEDLLNATRASDGPRYEVVNFGVAGYGTGQELLTLERDVFQFGPDLVVLAFFTGNDVSDNSPEMSDSGDPRPYFHVRDGALVADDSFLRSPVFRDRQGLAGRVYYAVQGHSRLVQLAYRVRRRLLHPPVDRPEVRVGHEPGLPSEVYRSPETASWTSAWQVTEALLEEMSTRARAGGAQFAVVTLTNAIQVHPNADVRREFMEDLGVDDLFYPDRRIEALGRRMGFPVHMLGPELQARAEDSQVYIHGFENTQLGVGHWNQEGHRLAAELIADWLRADVLDSAASGGTP